jgi:hypothetical protein
MIFYSLKTNNMQRILTMMLMVCIAGTVSIIVKIFCILLVFKE